MIYNATLRPDNERMRTDRIEETYEIEQFVGKNSFYRYEHVQRRWEYGLAMKLIKEYEPKTMLNVGGGNSPLSSWAVTKGVDVTEIDPNRPSRLLPDVRYIHQNFPSKDLGVYNLVVCTSVIEHVEDHAAFFRALLEHAKDVVFLTTDFHPSGKPFSYDHLRTYNEEDMTIMIHAAKLKGFSPIGKLDYRYDGPMVYDYTFASLALVRNV